MAAPITCKDLIVTIQGYNPSYTYRVGIRVSGSVTPFGYNQLFTKTATSSTVIFNDLDGAYLYEIAIETSCGLNSKSLSEWSNPIDPNCPNVVSAVYNSGASKFTITMPSNTQSFEWRIDKKEWNRVEGDGNASVIDIAIADIITLYSGYGTNANVLHEFEVRCVCRNVGKGLSRKVKYIINPTSSISIIGLDNLCKHGEYAGQLLRITMPTKALTNVLQSVVLTQPSSSLLTIASWTRVANASPELDIQLALLALNGFNLMSIISPNPDLRSSSIDFISDVPPEGIERNGPIPCGSYGFYYSIV